MAAHLDCPWNAAAVRILEDFGYKPKTLAQRWEDATAEIITEPDTLALAEALKMYCSTLLENWTMRQLDSDIADLLNKCLNLLQSVKTDEDATKWLSTTKIVMSRKLSNDLSKCG
jgi:hypothetical protein